MLNPYRSVGAHSISFVGTVTVILFLLFVQPVGARGQAGNQTHLTVTDASANSAVQANSQDSVVIKSALLKIADSVDVPVEQGGVLTEFTLKEGQSVKKGDLIGRLDDSQHRLRLARSKLEYSIASMAAASQVDVEYARKSHNVAVSDLRRSEQANMRVANSVPTSRIEKQRLERDRTMLQLQQAEREFKIAQLKTKLVLNDIAMAEDSLKKTTIVSPVDGVVVAIKKHAGEWVEPSQTLVKILKVDRLRIEGSIAASQARRLKIGMPVQVRFAVDWVGEPVAGTITFISPEANPHNLTVQVWAEIANTGQQLLPGLKGDVVIDLMR